MFRLSLLGTFCRQLVLIRDFRLFSNPLRTISIQTRGNERERSLLSFSRRPGATVPIERVIPAQNYVQAPTSAGHINDSTLDLSGRMMTSPCSRVGMCRVAPKVSPRGHPIFRAKTINRSGACPTKENG